MTEQTKQPETKEGKRKVALINLNDDIIKALAVAYLVENAEFGEIPKQSVHQRYLTTMTSEKGSKFVNQSIFNSDRGRYRGNLDEYGMLEKGMHIIQESIFSLKVSDVLEYVGAQAKIRRQFKDKYVNELSDDGKKAVIGSYQTRFIMEYVGDALKDTGNAPRKTLEDMFCEVEKKKDNLVKFNPNSQREYKQVG